MATPKLTQSESDFLLNLRMLTGREDREFIIQESQVHGLKAIIPEARSRSASPEASCALVNRILLMLSIGPMTREFFRVVFADIHMDSDVEVTRAVANFRIICMLECGNFRFGYKLFNRNTLALKDVWHRYFPKSEDETKRRKDLKEKPKIEGLASIPEDRLFAIGYIAYESAPRITGARTTLKPILEKAVRESATNWGDLVKCAPRDQKESLQSLLEHAALPDGELLIGGELFLQRARKKFQEALSLACNYCQPVSEDDIRKAQELAVQNSATYLSLHDLDVYVATSMRDPVHFTSNSNFVRQLFHDELSEYHIRYFDPTQSYLQDRVQKGLLECLMIKRASLTVYNAQESDTFGKDSELGVTLAQQKPAIVYVCRLLHDFDTLMPFYGLIDKSTDLSKQEFLKQATKSKYITRATQRELEAPERSKNDVIKAIVDHGMTDVMRAIPQEQIAGELMRHGYTTTGSAEDTWGLCLQKIARLESRAHTFKSIHPLSLQTSPLDGVARGVYVTRNVKQTAELILKLLTGAAEYEIREDENNWLLCEKTTNCPIRVVTKNKFLTAAFWSERWGNRHDKCPMIEAYVEATNVR